MKRQPTSALGTGFDTWLDEEGIRAEVDAGATKAALVKQLLARMKRLRIICVICEICGRKLRLAAQARKHLGRGLHQACARAS